MTLGVLNLSRGSREENCFLIRPDTSFLNELVGIFTLPLATSAFLSAQLAQAANRNGKTEINLLKIL